MTAPVWQHSDPETRHAAGLAPLPVPFSLRDARFRIIVKLIGLRSGKGTEAAYADYCAYEARCRAAGRPASIAEFRKEAGA